MVKWRTVLVAVTVSVVVGAAHAAERGGAKSDRGTSPAATAAPPPAKAASTTASAAPAAGEATTTRFGDWAWTCRPSASDGACEGTQLLRRSGDGADLAQYRLTPTKDAAILRLSVLVPANARMDSPPRLVRGGDTKEISSLKWTSCTLGGCRAEADVRVSELEALSRGASDGSGVIYLDASTRTVALPLVTNGLADLIKVAVAKVK